jgi:hypothetical protein
VRRVTLVTGTLLLSGLVATTLTAVSSDTSEMDTALSVTDTSLIAVARASSYMGELKFSHDMHTDDLELECTECHHETHAAQLEISHEDYFDDFWIDCQSCHNSATAQEPQSCANCHHSSVEDVADETRSAKVVLHQSCWSCHEVTTGVEASQSCGVCHTLSGGDA